MKKAFIIHRWDGSPDEPLYLWLKDNLKGFEIEIPEMPNPEEPVISEWVETLSNLDIDENTILIGHSIGCQTIMRYLEKSEKKVGKVIFIAPWFNLKGIEEEGPEVHEIARSWLETPINFEKVKQHCSKFVCIFSDNDPFVPISDKELFKERLGAEIIVENNKGHFIEEDGVTELPTVLKYI